MKTGIKTIAFILPNFQAGGAERVMVTIANHLDRVKFKPVIIAFTDEGPLKDLIFPDIEIISLGAAKIRYGTWAFIKTIRQGKPDIIISTMAHLNFLVLLTKPFLQHTPIIVREAITPSFFSDHKFKHFILNSGYCYLYPQAARIISPTKLVFDEMPWQLKKYKIKLVRIFNPVNVSMMEQDRNQNLRTEMATPQQKLFVAAGRLVQQKGFDRLIQTLEPWATRDDWRLVIMGDGPDRTSLQNLIDNMGLKQIRLAGFEAKPWRCYAVADAFLLPSRYEGLPNVALEALAMGAPVIAMNSAGGIAEIAEEASGTNVRIAASMEEFVNLMETVKAGDIASERKNLLPSCFSLPEIVAAYESVFTEATK